MEETYLTQGIVLNRRAFDEDGSRVIIYTEDKGKLELVARGTKKIKSKLAGHLEPFCLADIMVVRGKHYDYIGNAVSRNCYSQIKSDLVKLAIAGKAIKIFDKIIKIGQADREIFKNLKSFLEILNRNSASSNQDLLSYFFIFKIMISLGYEPQLYNCAICRSKIKPSGNRFNFKRGGLVCPGCGIKVKGEKAVVISDDSIKLLRLAKDLDLIKLMKIKINNKLKSELINIVGSFLSHHFEIKFNAT